MPTDPDLRSHLVAEQLRAVWSHARMAIAMGVVFALALAFALRDTVPMGWLLVWITLRLVVSISRAVQRVALADRHTPHGTSAYRGTLVLLGLDALLWGLGGASLMGSGEATPALVAASLACLACVATFGLQFSLAATMSYVLPTLLPLALVLAWRNDEFGWLGALGMMILVVLTVVTSRRSQQQLAEHIALNLRAEQLAHEKDEALRMALRQSAVRSQFLGNVSHELRTPLHGILGLARLLHLDAHDPLARRRTELIEASGRHLLTLINDLIDISRIEAGRFPLHVENFNLAAQLREVAEVHSVRAQDRGLAFRVDNAVVDPCWVSGDPARLRQVLYNLLGNALKFTHQGSVTLRITREPQFGNLLVEVEDTGPGIAPPHLERIFEAFHQVIGEGRHLVEGAGLGLKIARELALAMGGDVTVRSVLGRGTCFTFTAVLPAAEPVAADSGGLSTLRDIQAARPLRVLVAEDDEVNAMIAQASLERIGLQVERAHNGREAVARALRDHDRPDLVLMDCRMPELDGYSATREIRAAEYERGLPRLPVIALTATVTELGRAQCMEAGMDDFIAKPFTPEQLHAALLGWLGEAPPPLGLADGTGR